MEARLDLDDAPLGRFILDDDSVVLDVNPTAARWLGYAREELVGARVDLWLDGAERLFLQSQILPVLKLQGWVEEVALSFREKSGARVPVLVNAQRREDIAAAHEFAFLRVRQRARLEDELLQAKKLAEQASDAKTKFLAMMSHELRTPLQTISLGVEMLLQGEFGEITPEQRETLLSSESATATLVDLIDDILTFARMRAGQVQLNLENVKIVDTLNRAEVLVRDRLHQRGLAYERRCAESDITVRCDRKRVQQILLNLLNNALKFTPAGGCVTLGCRRGDGVALIEVTDTGAGIPEEQILRIFEPFVQLTSAVQGDEKSGVGLGLTICRDLAHAMGGDLRVRSRVGQGTTFTLSLPLGTAEAVVAPVLEATVSR